MQATSAAQPTRNGTRNGRTTVVFNGSQYLLFTGDTKVNVATVTIFVVCMETTELSNAGVVSLFATGGTDWNSNNGVAVETGATGITMENVRFYDGTNGAGKIFQNGAAPYGVYSAIYRANGADSIWYNTTTYGPGNIRNTTWGTATGGICIGARVLSGAPSTTYGLKGEIAEVIVCGTIVPDQVIVRVENYLRVKWGF